MDCSFATDNNMQTQLVRSMHMRDDSASVEGHSNRSAACQHPEQHAQQSEQRPNNGNGSVAGNAAVCAAAGAESAMDTGQAGSSVDHSATNGMHLRCAKSHAA
jgi:hypothetical protein